MCSVRSIRISNFPHCLLRRELQTPNSTCGTRRCFVTCDIIPHFSAPPAHRSITMWDSGMCGVDTDWPKRIYPATFPSLPAALEIPVRLAAGIVIIEESDNISMSHGRRRVTDHLLKNTFKSQIPLSSRVCVSIHPSIHPSTVIDWTVCPLIPQYACHSIQSRREV